MNSTIWKFDMRITDEQTLEIPQGAHILSVQQQDPQQPECISLWALCHPGNPVERRKFNIYGTGHPLHPPIGDYIGTVLIYGGVQVYHVFEVTDDKETKQD